MCHLYRHETENGLQVWNRDHDPKGLVSCPATHPIAYAQMSKKFYVVNVGVLYKGCCRKQDVDEIPCVSDSEDVVPCPGNSCRDHFRVRKHLSNNPNVNSNENSMRLDSECDDVIHEESGGYKFVDFACSFTYAINLSTRTWW